MGLILQFLISGFNLGDGAKDLHQTAPCVILWLKCVRMYSVVYLECYKHTNIISHTPFVLTDELHTFVHFISPT